MGLPGTSMSTAKPTTEPQLGFRLEELRVKSFEEVNINIGAKPIEIRNEQGAILRMFPRNGNLLFILEGGSKKATLVIYPRGNKGSAKTVSFDSRGQAEIKGTFSGAYVLSVSEKST